MSRAILKVSEDRVRDTRVVSVSVETSKDKNIVVGPRRALLNVVLLISIDSDCEVVLQNRVK